MYLKLAVAVLVGFCLGIGFHYYMSNKNTAYIVLSRDYRLDNGGIIKKGTQLKIDEGMSEGFTRYILFLNAKHLEGSPRATDTIDYSIPYWLRPANDSLR